MRLLSLCRMRRVWLFWLHRQQSSRVPAAHAHSLGFRASLWLWTGLLHAHEWISRAGNIQVFLGKTPFVILARGFNKGSCQRFSQLDFIFALRANDSWFGH